MNCQVAQEKITEGFAAGSAVLSQDVRTHQENCAKCRLFYKQETNLFALLDAGLQNLANQPVPTSLLPRLRAALEQTPLHHTFTLPAWSVVAVAATTVLVLSLSILWNRGQRAPLGHERAPVEAVVSKKTTPKSPHRSDARTIDSIRLATKTYTISPRAKMSEPVPEVIVAGAEREAYTRFVATHVGDRVRTPMTNVDSASAGEATLEIASLRIKTIEVQPLEGTEEEEP